MGQIHNPFNSGNYKLGERNPENYGLKKNLRLDWSTGNMNKWVFFNFLHINCNKKKRFTRNDADCDMTRSTGT